MSWFDIVKQLTPMQSRLKDIARKEGIEKFGDRTMIIRINKKMGDDFELTLRSKTTGEDRRSAYQFKFRNGELYMAEGPYLVYTASSRKDLYEEFENAINELMDSYRAKNPEPVAKPVQYTGKTGGRPVDMSGRPRPTRAKTKLTQEEYIRRAKKNESNIARQARMERAEMYGIDPDELL